MCGRVGSVACDAGAGACRGLHPLQLHPYSECQRTCQLYSKACLCTAAPGTLPHASPQPSPTRPCLPTNLLPAACSGHTTAAAFICGTLLFVLLPAALQVVEEQQQQQQEGRSAPGEHNAAQRTAAWLVERRWQLCSAGVATTAAGRLLADVHWCSDVLAGACLGTALTAGLALLCGVPDMNSGAAGPASAAAEAPQASRRR